jgi:serine/threonine-protein phosphatase 2A regulatory subunit B
MVRDFMSVKVWDLQMTSRPVESYAVHEYLRGKLCALYESDCLFDKFTCCWSGSDRCCVYYFVCHVLVLLQCDSWSS